MATIDIFNTTEKYDIIYTDPPWEQAKGGKKKARPNSSGMPLDYPTMNLQEIFDLHKNVFQTIASERHNVFMWTTEKYLHQTEKKMQELGYKLHIRFIYSKGMGQSPAFTVRFTHEYLLWFYKPGKMIMPSKETRGKYASVFCKKPKRHSQKPVFAYEMLEDMFPNCKKVEMFARNTRSGWDCWGNEV